MKAVRSKSNRILSKASYNLKEKFPGSDVEEGGPASQAKPSELRWGRGGEVNKTLCWSYKRFTNQETPSLHWKVNSRKLKISQAFRILYLPQIINKHHIRLQDITCPALLRSVFDRGGTIYFIIL